MKVIINVNQKSSYSYLNGRTFEIKELLSSMISVEIKGITIDFGFKEIFIVDIEKELEKLDEQTESINSTLRRLSTTIEDKKELNELEGGNNLKLIREISNTIEMKESYKPLLEKIENQKINLRKYILCKQIQVI